MEQATTRLAFERAYPPGLPISTLAAYILLTLPPVPTRRTPRSHSASRATVTTGTTGILLAPGFHLTHVTVWIVAIFLKPSWRRRY